jgi:GTPase SAR1 family protein
MASRMELPSLQGLQTAEQMELLNVVDDLRAHGLGEITALPQLIVCGDQSSGKSSVLEAISGVPFPRQDGLCTRFATEFILRRAPKDALSVSIIALQDRKDQDEIDKIHQFRHELTRREDFPELFEKAKEVILSGLDQSFSEDILRVEFCGPTQPQLTLVDLPGLIHSETKAQTANDVKVVTRLVSEYLINPRSIILAVVSSTYDHSNQIILSLARKVDPQGRRTLGIITKPDKLLRGSLEEDRVIKLARNEDVHFDLGWHVVKNVDMALQEAQRQNRDEQEKEFFRDTNFTNLSSTTIGVTSLRTRLSKVLFDQIRTELPRLLEDIEKRIKEAKVKSDKLGPGRPKLDDQKSFLIDLSQSFHNISRDAVRGDYDQDFFQCDFIDERRLCASLMNRHFEFAETLRKKGALWTIVEKQNDKPNCRTREHAIQEACKLLKRSRGREVRYSFRCFPKNFNSFSFLSSLCFSFLSVLGVVHFAVVV